MGLVELTVADGVATLTLNNPPLNLNSRAMTRAIDQHIRRVAGDESIRVLVLAGAGDRAFSAGSDVKEIAGLLEPGKMVQEKLAYENEVWNRLAGLPKPTIAALDGLAYGGGLELALCCDLRVAAEDVRLALPEIKLGWFPGGGGTQRLARLVGPARAKELMFFGEPISAQEALAMGLVNRVVPRGQALAAAQEMARTLAQRPAKALAYIKEAVDRGLDMSLAEGLALELSLSDRVFATEDAREGVRAFLAKETPRFRHR